MGCSNVKSISNNVGGIKNSDKRIKIFEYLKTRSILMEWYSFKKRIPLKKTKKK